MLEIVGLKLNFANIEKKSDRIPRSIDVGLDILKVFANEDGSLAIEFLYKVDYNQDCSSLRIGGIGYFRGESELVGKAISDFRKNKKLSPDIHMSVANPIGAEVGLNSLFLMRPFGIVPHFFPPPIVVKENVQIPTTTKNVKPKK